MKFRRCLFRPTTKRGISPQRLAAARRWLDREAASLPLFMDQVRTSQPTPEERVQAADESFAAWRRQFRTLTARQWREARRILHELPPGERAALIAAWNASPYPKDSAYCLEFIRQQARTEESHPTASHPDPPKSERPMITGIAYLILREPRDPTRRFTSYAHPDGESVTIRIQDSGRDGHLRALRPGGGRAARRAPLAGRLPRRRGAAHAASAGAAGSALPAETCPCGHRRA
jgi:hypothetical protein